MGGGQPIVDPFFGLLRRTLFKGKQPYLSDGIFAALWALSQAIEPNPGGIAGPPRIGVIVKTGKGYESKLLTDEDLAEHQSNVDEAEDYLSKYYDHLCGKPQTITPQPQPPATPKTPLATPIVPAG